MVANNNKGGLTVSKSTVRRFEVVTTDGVAREMCRYDHATVISKEFRCCDPKWTCPDLVEAYTLWLFVIEMNHIPTYDRWRSFGVNQGNIVEIDLERGVYR